MDATFPDGKGSGTKARGPSSRRHATRGRTRGLRWRLGAQMQTAVIREGEVAWQERMLPTRQEGPALRPPVTVPQCYLHPAPHCCLLPRHRAHSVISRTVSRLFTRQTSRSHTPHMPAKLSVAWRR
jgi:hypothetical protein